MLILLQNVSWYILFSVFSSLDVKFLERKHVIDEEYTLVVWRNNVINDAIKRMECPAFHPGKKVVSNQGNKRQEGKLYHLIACLRRVCILYMVLSCICQQLPFLT